MRTREIYFPKGEGDTSGISIGYIKSRDVLRIGGWYDSIVGIEDTEITFTDFCQRLGIDLNKKREIK